MAAVDATSAVSSRGRARPRGRSEPVSGTSVPSSVLLEAIVRAVSRAVELDAGPAQLGDGKQLLDLEETAQLLGVSRMTVARMADEGQLPSVVIRRGQVQKTRRIPRAFIERLIADARAGAEVDMEQYATAWLAEQAASDH